MMYNRDKRIILNTFLIVTLLTAACNRDFSACFSKAHEGYRDTQRNWHRVIHEAVLDHDKNLRELSELNTELQIALIDRAAIRLQSLADRTPPEVRLDGNPADLLNPGNWSDTDESGLLQQDRAYADLTENISELRVQVNGHPDWPKLRALFQSELREHPSVLKAQTELQQAGDRFLREARTCPE